MIDGLPIGIAPNLVLILVPLGVGWIVLWPARTRLGVAAYHVSAFPVGLLGWATVAAVASVFASPYNGLVVLAGLASFAALGFALLWWAAKDRSGGATVRLWTYALWGYAFYKLAAYVVTTGLTRVTVDSCMFYESYGVWLHDTGLLSADLVSARASLLPAFAAANRWFGGDWTYAIYPMIAAHLVLFVAYVVYRMSSDRVPRSVRATVAIGSGLLMGISGAYGVQWLLVHSHAASALYISLAVSGVLVIAADRSEESSGYDSSAVSWSALAGLATAGLILARPDGLAYAFIPASLLVCACLWRDLAPRVLSAFFVPAVGFPAFIMASTFVRNGLWVRESKLGGAAALVLLVLLAAMPIASFVIQSRWGHRFRGRDVALGFVMLLFAAAAVTAVLVDLRQGVETLGVMRQNLFHVGDNGPMWYFLGVVYVVSIVAGLWLEDLTVRWLTVALFQFFSVAVAVHVLMHPGRLGWGDSFNRVSFHAVPLGFMLLGTSVIAAIALLDRRDAPADSGSLHEEFGAVPEA